MDRLEAWKAPSNKPCLQDFTGCLERFAWVFPAAHFPHRGLGLYQRRCPPLIDGSMHKGHHHAYTSRDDMIAAGKYRKVGARVMLFSRARLRSEERRVG